MPVTRIPIDGLWRCLCPSIDAIAVSCTATSAISAQRRASSNGPSFNRPRRSFHGSTQARKGAGNTRQDQSHTAHIGPIWGATPKEQWQIQECLEEEKDRDQESKDAMGEDLMRGATTKGEPSITKQRSVEERNNRLRYIVTHRSLGNVVRKTLSTPLNIEEAREMVRENDRRSRSPKKVHAEQMLVDNKDENSIIRKIALSSKKFEVGEKSTEELYDRLQEVTAMSGAFHQIIDIVDYLVRVKGEGPNLVLFDALIRANADAEHGSAEAVRTLLEEMKQEGINADLGLYHAVLQVLAIHPDYLLRNEILQEMKERWLSLSPEGWHNLVTGLLRERQFEAAMEKLEQMQSEHIPIQPWLYDVFTYNLCQHDELDEAFNLLCFRSKYDKKDISPSLWYYLLDKFASEFHYAGTSYIWNNRVSTGHLNPSDGICVSALNVAARNADPSLATSAIRYLAARQTTLFPYHYEALLAAHTAAEDLKTPFRILGIIEKAGFEPDSAMTRPLYLYLTSSTTLPYQAWTVLKEQFKEGHAIHIAAVNVVIEACIGVNKFDRALQMYKELHTICETGATTETFNILLQGAEKTGSKEPAMFVASEMSAMGVKPSSLTYDRLILACLTAEDYEDAFRYLEEMMDVGKDMFEEGKKGWYMRNGTAHFLARRCAASGDGRAWDVVAQLESRGHDTSNLRKSLEQNWGTSSKHTKEERDLQLAC